MPPLEARRSERVDYNAEVELLAHAGAVGAPHRVFAHAFDLGAGGMRVAGPLDMAVGEEVTCRMTLDGRPASLPGRVAWRREGNTRDAITAHWLGICFQPLGAYESGLLQHVVERSSAGYRPVELHFAGFDQRVVARARARTNGLRLSAALPIFARDTELTFQLDEEGPLFTGRIGDVALREENGLRRLEIEVDVIDDAVRFRRRARYGFADEIEAEELSETEAGELSETEAGEPREPEAARHASFADTQPNPALGRTVEVRRPRARGWWPSMLLATIAGGALAWYAAAQLREAPPRETETETETEAEFVARPREPDDALARALTMPAAPTVDTRPAAAPAINPAPPDSDSAPALRGGASSDSAPALRGGASDPSAHEFARPTVLPSPAAEPPVASVLDSEHFPSAPQSDVEGDVTRIRIPFSGSLEKMRAVVWAAPATLAIDVPDASTSLEYRRYIVAGAGVTELRVNKSEAALLLRVRLSAPVARYAMTAENGTLEILIQRAAQHAR
jgi:hypothetical protein